MRSTGTALDFNYVFVSSEFDQDSEYNDIFGLFIKVNDGEFENIALLPEGEMVTITSLRTDPLTNPAGAKITNDTQLRYITTDIEKVNSPYNGYSIVLTASKKVAVGDVITVKFVIADVGDRGYDSSIIMQKGSFKFTAKGNSITSLTEGTELELNRPAENGAADFSVKVDGIALPNNLYSVENADTKKPVIKFTEGANLNCQSVIEIGIVGITEPIVITNNLAHQWSTQYENDADGHWKKCTVNGCDETTEKTEHGYTYTASDNIITENCICGHEETATLNAPSGDVVYDGAKKIATVSYSENWKGGNLTVTHNNNINAGNLSASASISIKGATAEIYWTILTATPLYDIPTDLTATYGETLADVTLPTATNGTWTWMSEKTSVGNVGSKTFKAIFTPNDNNNYITVEVDVPVTVNKADPQHSVPTGITATYGEILADITLPSGWSWDDSLTTSVGNVGTKIFVGVFTPTDTENYKTVKADITVTVRKADSTYTEPTARLNLVYNGDAMELINAGSAVGGEMQYVLGANSTTAPTDNWSTTIPTGKNAGTYYVWYRVVGDSNHNDVAPTCVPVTIAKAQLTVTANNKTITYGDTPANNGVTYAGFVPNEIEHVLGGTLEYDYSYTQYDNVGSYDITPKGLTSDNYEITFVKGTLTVEQREISIQWGATEFIPYNGNKQVPKVTAGNLVNNDSCDLTVEVVETTEGAGIIPGRWNARITALSNGNYCLPKDGRLVQVDYSISKGHQNAPTVSGVAETVKGKADGKITGLTTEMEYATEFTADDDKYTKVTDANMNFASGTYYVRYQAKGYYNHSTFTEVTIGEGRKLKVTVPQNQVGYTLTVDKSALDWREEFTLTYALEDGYTELSNFAVEVNGSPVILTDGKYTVTDPEEDIVITVTGVADITAPTAQISIKDNKWSSFLNNITFGLFFKETQDVTITATDAGGGVNTIQYYLAGGELELDEVRAITNWQDYNGTFKINPDNRYVVYVKVTDNAGNTQYISSDGIVLDATAPSVYGIEDGGVYYGDKIFKAMDDNFLKIEVDGVDITDTTEGDDEFKIVADNEEHTVTVTDKARNVTEYTVTVYKRYSVTFTNDEGGSYEKEFKYGEVIIIPTNEFFEDTFRKTGYTLIEWQGYTEGMTMPLENLTFTAVYDPNSYTVEFDANGGEPIATVTVIFGEKYGRLPSSAITGLSGGDKNWYLVDANGNVTETNIKNLTFVSTARDHKLFIKRNVLSPNVSITLTVPGGISDGYQYYIPGASQRVLTATINNGNTELLNYTYQWYKDGTLIEGATASVLTLDGNVADSGTYKVEVTATLKEGANIVVTTSSATGSKEQKVKILHAANTLSYDANGGEGGPQSSYTGGTSLDVSKDLPTREHYDFIGWNTKADGSGGSYKVEDVYTFTEDGGNGGCEITLYAQWKVKEYTVTYKADGQTVSVEKVEYGKDAILPAVPAKDGYVGKWDSNGKNIIGDTEINAVYTINKYTVTYKADGKVVGTVEVEHGKDAIAPAIPEKEGYTQTAPTWDKDGKNITADTEINAVYTQDPIEQPDDTKSPQTGDNSNLWLWVVLAFVSGGMLFGTLIWKKKEEAKQN